jgi:hypothetical protein
MPALESMTPLSSTPWADRSQENVNPVELALFRTTPSAPAAKIRFAKHVLERNPDSIWPRLMLSHYAPTVAESSSWLIMACQVGERLWQPWLDGEQSIEWWTDERTKPFMLAVAAYGVLLAKHGSAPESAQCLRLLLELDSADGMGAVRQFTEAGLVHQCFGSEAPGRRM